VEFHEHKAYETGDDFRRVDWKVAARTGRLFMKTYREERSVRAVAMVDVSRSMRTPFPGAGGRTRLEAASAFAFLMERLFFFHKEEFGLGSFAGRLLDWTPPETGGEHHRRLCALIETWRAATASSEKVLRQTDFTQALHGAGERLGAPTDLYLLSDFYAEAAGLEKSLAPLISRGHALTLVCVLEPLEFAPQSPPGSELIAVDGETGAKERVDSLVFRKGYGAAAEAHLAELSSWARQRGLGWLPWWAGRPAFPQFLSILEGR
jgi:uncharacterized protein (DUF58 family)